MMQTLCHLPTVDSRKLKTPGAQRLKPSPGGLVTQLCFPDMARVYYSGVWA